MQSILHEAALCPSILHEAAVCPSIYMKQHCVPVLYMKQQCVPGFTWSSSVSQDLHEAALCPRIFWIQETFEDTKGVIRIHKSKEDRHHNGQTIKDKQRSTKHYT
jgi:hypothetical protein